MKKITKFKDQKILVLGLARSGMAAALVLNELGAIVTVNDGKPFEENPAAQSLLEEGIKVVTGGHPLELLDEELCQRYFVAQGEGRFKVVPTLAGRVCCARLNVLELAKAPMTGMDVIFCQNLLIYFRRWRRREILNRLAECLAPGGLLVVGVGEVVGWHHPELQPVADEQVLAFTRKG